MADATAPLLQRTGPLDNATGVSATSDLLLGFNEAVRAGSGFIKIYKSDGTLFLSIAANDTSQVTLDSTGTRVTINPSVSLLAGTSFYVIIDPGAFEDLAGNDYAGLSSPTAFNFSTAGSGGGTPPADTTAPTLTNKSPADDAGNVPVGANLVLTFSEAIKADTGSIQIHGSNGTLVTIDVTDASQIAIVGNQLTINPASNLAANTSYYVTFGSGVIRDLANNAYSGIVSQTQFNFSTADSYVDKTTPLLLFKPKYETYGSVSQNVVLTFNEPVKAGTGFIEIRDRADGSLYRSISVNDASQVTFSDRSITLNPSADLDLNRAYTVVLAPGVIEDTRGNDFDGTTVDLATFVFPGGVQATAIEASGGLIAGNDVSVDLTLLDYDAAMNGTLLSVTSTRVDILGTDGLTYRFFGPSFNATATTIAELGAGYVGLVEVWAGAGASAHILHSDYVYISSVQSAGDFSIASSLWGKDTVIGSSADDVLFGYSGNDTLRGREGEDVIDGGVGDDLILGGLGSDNLAGDIGYDTFKFESLAELNGDSVNGFEGGDKLDLGAIAGLTFIGAGAFTGAAGQVRYAYGAGKTTLQIDSDGNSAADVSLVLNGGQFVLGETQPGSRVLVLTSDTGVPQLVSTAPADNATNIPIPAGFKLTFDENVVAGSGFIEFHRSSDGALIQSIDVATSAVSFIGRDVYFSAMYGFAPDTEYYVKFGAGVIKDTVGNSFAGIASSTELSFRTQEKTPPLLVSASPADNASNVALNASIVLTFNEPVTVGSVAILRASDYLVFETMQVGDPRVTFSGNSITINPNGSFAAGTDYIVSMGITDLAGNPYAGFPNSSYNFTTAGTVDTERPVLLTASPADEATNVPVGSNFVFTFNETVQPGSPGAVFFYRASDNVLVNTVYIEDATQVTFSGNKVTINPSADLAAGTSYYVILGDGSIKDMAGNKASALWTSSQLNFTTSATPGSASGLTGNGQSNIIAGGAGNDVITGLGRGDMLTGGGGSDTFVYTNRSDSTGRNYDTIKDFDPYADFIDLWFQITGVDAWITMGSLSETRFDSTLASTIGASRLAGHHAVLFTPNGGTLAGSTFLVIDANGTPGYQSTGDMVILLGYSPNIGALSGADFI